MKVEDKVSEQKFSMKETAEYLGGISHITVWREIKRGNLGCYRVGAGRIFVGASHIRDYLKRCEVRAV